MHFSNHEVALYIEANSSTFYASTWKRYSQVYTTRFGATTSTSWPFYLLYLVLSFPAIVLYIWLTCTLFVQFSILDTYLLCFGVFFSNVTCALPLVICHIPHWDPFTTYFNSLYSYYEPVSSTLFCCTFTFLVIYSYASIYYIYLLFLQLQNAHF